MLFCIFILSFITFTISCPAGLQIYDDTPSEDVTVISERITVPGPKPQSSQSSQVHVSINGHTSLKHARFTVSLLLSYRDCLKDNCNIFFKDSSLRWFDTGTKNSRTNNAFPKMKQEKENSQFACDFHLFWFYYIAIGKKTRTKLFLKPTNIYRPSQA